MPYKWQFGLQDSASLLMDATVRFHNIMLVIMFAIMLVISSLLIYILFRFSKERNPSPSKFSDNLALEIGWFVVGFAICMVILVPSINLLKQEEHIPKSDMTIKVVGHQWYWSYYYPDYGTVGFDSNIRHDIKPGEHRLLEVDNQLFVPVGINIRFIITSSDVIHSWAIPSLGIKKDAIPGRLNETWVNIKKPGLYYGQCSELCGFAHGFMPIAIKAVTKDEFEKWIKEVKNNV